VSLELPGPTFELDLLTRCEGTEGESGGFSSAGAVKSKSGTVTPETSEESLNSTHMFAIQLQIDPAFRATAPPQVTSAPPPSPSINARANPQFASHMSPIFTEQWTTEQRLREVQRERDSARLRNLQKAKPFWCMHGSRYVISTAFFFVADPLLGSRRAHRR
jgi:hypothetical protein